jgi:hypothetical protein
MHTKAGLTIRAPWGNIEIPQFTPERHQSGMVSRFHFPAHPFKAASPPGAIGVRTDRNVWWRFVGLAKAGIEPDWPGTRHDSRPHWAHENGAYRLRVRFQWR